MTKYRDPSFQERIASAARAREDVLARLKSKPPLDEGVAAARVAAQRLKDAAKQEERRLARLAADEAKAAKRAEREKQAASGAAAQKPELTEAERKAARDARYLARKSRTTS